MLEEQHHAALEDGATANLVQLFGTNTAKSQPVSAGRDDSGRSHESLGMTKGHGFRNYSRSGILLANRRALTPVSRLPHHAASAGNDCVSSERRLARLHRRRDDPARDIGESLGVTCGRC